MAICARIAGAGLPVTATDLRRELRPEVIATGARWTDSLEEVGAQSEVVITVLPGPAEVTELTDRLVGTLAPGSTWIDLTSATPEVGDHIAQVARGRGVRTLDAPVGGSPDAARNGQLLVFAGGEADDLETQRGLLETFASSIVHVGGTGDGYLAKLLVNLLWFGQAIAASEALSLAARFGLDPETFRAAVQESAAASRFIETDAPSLLRGDDMPAFSLGRCVEELDGVLTLARRLDVEPTVAERVTEVYADALHRYGDVPGELLGARLVAERAGVTFGRRSQT